MKNMKNNGHVLATINPSLPFVEAPRHDIDDINETPIVESKKAIGSDDAVTKERGNSLIIEQEIRQFHCPHFSSTTEAEKRRRKIQAIH